jgi:hypothetical protein
MRYYIDQNGITYIGKWMINDWNDDWLIIDWKDYWLINDWKVGEQNLKQLLHKVKFSIHILCRNSE